MPKQRSESNEKCALCSKATGDSWLSCEICGDCDWYHAKCLQLSDEAYKVLQDLWFCKTCNDKVRKIIPFLAGLQVRMTVTEKTITIMENYMGKNGQIIKLKSNIAKISGD